MSILLIDWQMFHKAHLKFVVVVSVVVLCVVLLKLQIQNVALVRSVLVLVRMFYEMKMS